MKASFETLYCNLAKRILLIFRGRRIPILERSMPIMSTSMVAKSMEIEHVKPLGVMIIYHLHWHIIDYFNDRMMLPAAPPLLTLFQIIANDYPGQAISHIHRCIWTL